MNYLKCLHHLLFRIIGHTNHDNALALALNPGIEWGKRWIVAVGRRYLIVTLILINHRRLKSTEELLAIKIANDGNC